MTLLYDGSIPRIVPGEYPQALRDACSIFQVEPEALLDFAVKKGEVIVILPGGMKSSVPIQGEWGKGVGKKRK